MYNSTMMVSTAYSRADSLISMDKPTRNNKQKNMSWW